MILEAIKIALTHDDAFCRRENCDLMVATTHPETPIHTPHFVNKNAKISRVVIPKND